LSVEDRVLALVELLYQSGYEAEIWRPFANALSIELGEAAVLITTDEDDWVAPHERYWFGVQPSSVTIYKRHVERGLPWGSQKQASFRNGFCRTSEIVSSQELAATPFYQEWMRPQGLACEGPLVHTMADYDRRPGWSMAIYRVEGRRPFSSNDVVLCDLLAGHLSTHTQLYEELDRVHRERVAFAEVIDRLLNGVLLVNASAELLLTNREARRILDTNDGVSLDQGFVRLASDEANDELREALADAINWRGRDPFGAGCELLLERPSGERPYIASAVPMNEAQLDSAFGDEVAVILVADVAADQTAAAAGARRTFDLTEAESEVIRLLAEGLPLEAISLQRKVSLNTTRTHLKHLFSKTGASSQSDLVRIVLAPGTESE
jgi:DNA-binding CsgD family transcriptional regulator